jgi:hypothetical protein
METLMVLDRERPNYLTKPRHAKLVGREVVPCNLFESMESFSDSRNIIRQDMIGNMKVSTVFLAINHGFGERNLWFETMIFGGHLDQYQDRYETWEEASEGHKVAVRLALGKLYFWQRWWLIIKGVYNAKKSKGA